jgi:hypothetical protein
MQTDLTKLQDRSSTYNFVKSNDTIVREHQIAAEHKKILRRELKECLASNHEISNEKCYDLRVAYVNLLQDRFEGMVFPAGMEPKNRVQPRIATPGL